MKVVRGADAESFAERAVPFLLRDPARHNLMLAILDTLQRHPATYPEHYTWCVEDAGRVVAAALMTPPYDVVVSRADDDAAIEALAQALDEAGVRPPGVVGARPEADRFADVWIGRHGGDRRVVTRQGIYELVEVVARGRAPGNARLASDADVALVVRWHEDFIAEVAPDAQTDRALRERRIRTLVSEDGFWLWEDAGEPVSVTGSAPTPPDAVRIGPVYTPPELRGRGYATALVAHVSQDALDHGRRACYLHTDLANPTSNAIYARIGYTMVAEGIDVRFTP